MSEATTPTLYMLVVAKSITMHFANASYWYCQGALTWTLMVHFDVCLLLLYDKWQLQECKIFLQQQIFLTLEFCWAYFHSWAKMTFMHDPLNIDPHLFCSHKSQYYNCSIVRSIGSDLFLEASWLHTFMSLYSLVRLYFHKLFQLAA